MKYNPHGQRVKIEDGDIHVARLDWPEIHHAHMVDLLRDEQAVEDAIRANANVNYGTARVNTATSTGGDIVNFAICPCGQGFYAFTGRRDPYWLGD